MQRDTQIGPEADQRAATERLALMLLRLAGDQSVRVIEALAAALANRVRLQAETLDDQQIFAESRPWCATSGTEGQRHQDPRARLQLCRRVARRALSRSLPDPTHGATAFHRVDEYPAWARNLLPVAALGPFLFYRLPLDRVAMSAPIDQPRPGEGAEAA